MDLSLIQTRTSVMSHFHAEFSELGRFLANPAKQFPRSTQQESCLRVLVYFVLALCFGFLFQLTAVPLIVQLASQEPIAHSISHPRVFAYSAVLIAPLLEEFIFRFGLIYARYALSLGALLVILFANPDPTLLIIFASIAITLQLVLSMQIYRSNIHKGLSWKTFFSDQSTDYSRPVFWLFTIAFVFVHMSNFAISKPHHWFIVFMLIPQFAIGIILGYLRMRQGFLSAFSLHFLFNFTIACLPFIFGD